MTKAQLAKHEKIEARRVRTKLATAAPAEVKIPATGLVKMQVPTTARQVAKFQALAEARRPTFEALAGQTLDDPDDIAFVDALLTEVVQLEDAAKAMRSSATGPLYGVIRTVESWFKPYLEELLYAKGVCKKLIGDARIAQAELASEARTVAADAAKVGDAETVVAALNVANEAARPDEAAATTRITWRVKKIAADLLPDTIDTPAGKLELWCPDVAAIQAYADLCAGEVPPIPGVTFERVAAVGAKH
jgi:hypothetical protein